MTIAFWIVAGLTALAFFGAGLMKLLRPIPALKESGMKWVDDFPNPFIRLIALAEAIGAVGIIVPPLTGIAPLLSPIAAVCLVIIMVGAVVVHLRRKENPAPSVVLTVLAVVTAVLGFIVWA